MLLEYWVRGSQPMWLSQEANHKIGKQASWEIFTIYFSVKQTQLQNPENVFLNSLIFIYFQDTRVSIILLLSSVNSFPWGLKSCLLSITNAQSYPYSILHGSDGKESTCNARAPGSILGSGRSPGERNGNPLQYSCLENSMDRGSWWATVHGVAELDTTEWLTLTHTHTQVASRKGITLVCGWDLWKLYLYWRGTLKWWAKDWENMAPSVFSLQAVILLLCISFPSTAVSSIMYSSSSWPD